MLATTQPTRDQVEATADFLVRLYRAAMPDDFDGAVMLALRLGIVRSGPKHLRDMCGALTYISDNRAAGAELARRLLLPAPAIP